jgi:hypothetical protein
VNHRFDEPKCQCGVHCERSREAPGTRGLHLDNTTGGECALRLEARGPDRVDEGTLSLSRSRDVEGSVEESALSFYLRHTSSIACDQSLSGYRIHFAARSMRLESTCLVQPWYGFWQQPFEFSTQLSATLGQAAATSIHCIMTFLCCTDRRGCRLARVEVLQKGSTVNSDSNFHIGALDRVLTFDGVFRSRGKVEVEGTGTPNS